MSTEVKPRGNRGRRSAKRPYVHRTNAVHITIYSQDGSPVPKVVLEEAAQSVTDIALKHGLLIALADT